MDSQFIGETTTRKRKSIENSAETHTVHIEDDVDTLPPPSGISRGDFGGLPSKIQAVRSTKSTMELYEDIFSVSSDLPNTKKPLGLKARYNRIRAKVVEAMDAFEKCRSKDFYYFTPVEVARNLAPADYLKHKWDDTARDRYLMKHEWKADGTFSIISAAPLNDDHALRTMVFIPLVRWQPRVQSLPSWGACYEGVMRVADLCLKPIVTASDWGPIAAVFETHAGYMSPRQLRANLRLVLKGHSQSARYGVLLHVFPEDWGVAAVQWRRDEQHPEGFQLVAALDCGVSALSSAAKALYALQQPSDTHMPAVPVDRWVRHALVADDNYDTAADTPFNVQDGVDGGTTWYINAHSPGLPILHFNKADVLLSEDIPDEVKVGQFEYDVCGVLVRIVHRQLPSGAQSGAPPGTSSAV